MPNRQLPKRFTPIWEGPIEGYATNYLSKNGWRAQGYSWEDLMQEAYLVFLECKERYSSSGAERIVDTPQWFMALFKRCLFTRMTDLSNTSTATKAISESDLSSDGDEFSFDNLPGPIGVSYEFLELIERAPREVAMVLSLLFEAPNEVLEMAQEAWRSSGRKKVQGNVFLCNLLGLDPARIHLPTAVSNYFTHGTWRM